MKPLIVALLIMATPVSVLAEEIIFYRIAGDNGTFTFLNVQSSMTIPPMLQEIAVKTLKKPFSPEVIHKEFYHITVTEEVIWQGMSLKQFDYIPKQKDRFRHVLWTTPDLSSVVKLEVYDTDNHLLYCAVKLQEDDKPPVPVPSEAIIKPAQKLQGGDKNYFGFNDALTETQLDGSMRILFTDGLNRFSVFRSPITPKDKPEPEQVILYGNYIFNKVHGKFRYTVVGTIPFDKMEEVVLLTISSVESAKAQDIITEKPGNKQLNP